MAITRTAFGTLDDGREASLYALENTNGLRADILDYGGAVHALFVPGPGGERIDVALGQADLKGYMEGKGFLGVLVGRNANRIAGASFGLGGKTRTLEANDGANNLHSGSNGLHRRLFAARAAETGYGPVLRLDAAIPHLADGFPGNLDLRVEYCVTNDDALRIRYRAVCDAETVVNPTCHAYFNLRGHASGPALDQRLWLNAPCYLPAGRDKVPDGEIRLVAGTPMDFTTPKPLGRDIAADFPMLVRCGGYDVTYALAGSGERQVATLFEPSGGLAMEVFTDLPGLQLFTGNSLSPDRTYKDGVHYRPHQGVCLETEFFPNAVNTPWFMSPVLKAGETFVSTTTYRFSRPRG